MTRPWVHHGKEEVLSMRLGKEEAVGYVEDTDIESPVAEEIVIDQPERMPLIAAVPTTTGDSPLIVR
jgi:hypothetical protein